MIRNNKYVIVSNYDWEHYHDVLGNTIVYSELFNIPGVGCARAILKQEFNEDGTEQMLYLIRYLDAQAYLNYFMDVHNE